MWGGSSAGRASRSQCEGREFDPPPLHQFCARLLLAALLWSPALWPGEPARQEAVGVLRVGTPGDYAPYAWFDSVTGTYRGADIALARALAMELGRRVEFVPTTWATLTSDAEAGRFDIGVGGISVTPERAQRVKFSTELTRDHKLPVVRCGEERRYDSAAKLNRPAVRLVVNRGGTNERFSRERFPDAALLVHADNRTVFDEIRAGRADVMVTDAVEGRLQQRSGSGLCVARVKEEWAPASKAVLIAAAALQPDIQAALGRLGGVKRYRRELAAWEGYGWSQLQTPELQLAALIDERLGVVTEVARAKWNAQAAIEDAPRERALLASMRERALSLEVPAATVEKFFAAQIEAAKVLQRELYAQWRRQRQGQFADVADLGSVLRPRIDDINARMLELLASQSGKNSRMPAISTLNLVSPAAVKAANR